jgi:hypothetical protein
MKADQAADTVTTAVVLGLVPAAVVVSVVYLRAVLFVAVELPDSP